MKLRWLILIIIILTAAVMADFENSIWQPATANLTNWSNTATNSYVSSTNGSARGLNLLGLTTTAGQTNANGLTNSGTFLEIGNSTNSGWVASAGPNTNYGLSVHLSATYGQSITNGVNTTNGGIFLQLGAQTNASWVTALGPVTNNGVQVVLGNETNAGTLDVTGQITGYSAITSTAGGTNTFGPTIVTNWFTVVGTGGFNNAGWTTNAGAFTNGGLLLQLGNQTNAGWTASAGPNTNYGLSLHLGATYAQSFTNGVNTTNGGILLQLGAQTNASWMTAFGPVTNNGLAVHLSATYAQSFTNGVNTTNGGVLLQLGGQTNASWVNLAGPTTNFSKLLLVGGPLAMATNTPAATGSGSTNFIIDCSLANNFFVFPTANFKIWVTNSVAGYWGRIFIKQDGGGSRLMVYDASNIKTNASLVLSTAASSKDRIDITADDQGTNVQAFLYKAFQ